MASQTSQFRQSVERSSQEGEKYSLERTSVSSDAPLNKDGEDVEAQLVTPAQPPPAQPLEYSTSTTKKLVFLGLYFFLSLGLTLSNKALMKKVGLIVVPTRRRPNGLTCHTGQASMASHGTTHWIHLRRMFRSAREWTTQAVATRHQREPGAGRILYALHPQHCDQQCISVRLTHCNSVVALANKMIARLYRYHSTRSFDPPAPSRPLLSTALYTADPTPAIPTCR